MRYVKPEALGAGPWSRAGKRDAKFNAWLRVAAQAPRSFSVGSRLRVDRARRLDDYARSEWASKTLTDSALYGLPLRAMKP